MSAYYQIKTKTLFITIMLEAATRNKIIFMKKY